MAHTLVTIKNGSRTNCYLDTDKSEALRDFRKECYEKVTEREWSEIKNLLEIQELEFEQKFYACEVWI